ncbi:hypothetical protein SAMN02910325_01545 [Ruminococcus flavefaciens]|uniref:Ribbon-helix-helix protein CopG domain-containing protein n=2 Tax=Ruminococcus flavefaciens TaxID=1265 RepID=A0A315Y1D2_RUMFL|nr:hypothetical protein IE37_01545 [Ruminococcus flavefaciens]SSA48620.1 hypothetical protein SAMN02910325_01545 [Ruminococcus flavefaciens]
MYLMKKSVYSLVLMDDVIKAVDEQAYRLGTSRSNLINQILAEHLSCVTPEMRMREIFAQMTELMNSSFRIQEQRSPSLMTVKTALEYKYRPTINYKVELERSPQQYLGTLRVSIRTQSAALIDMFHSFFAYRAKLENSYLSRLGINSYSCEIGDGSFSRRLINTGALTGEQAGEAIGEYIKDLDHAVKTYFAAPETFGESAPILEKDYRALLGRYII